MQCPVKASVMNVWLSNQIRTYVTFIGKLQYIFTYNVVNEVVLDRAATSKAMRSGPIQGDS